MTVQTSIMSRLGTVDPRITGFLRVWREARAGRLVPLKRDIDPIRFPRLLPYVWLYRFDPERDDFVCRLAGEEVNGAWQRSIKGLTLREIVGDKDQPTIRGRWDQIISEPLVQYGAAVERLTALTLHRAERMLVPLASDDGTCDHILGLSLYHLDERSSTRGALVPEDIIRIPCSEL